MVMFLEQKGDLRSEESIAEQQTLTGVCTDVFEIDTLPHRIFNDEKGSSAVGRNEDARHGPVPGIFEQPEQELAYRFWLQLG
jgi:hypothetical protein